jgi:hypothetical protein
MCQIQIPNRMVIIYMYVYEADPYPKYSHYSYQIKSNIFIPTLKVLSDEN